MDYEKAWNILKSTLDSERKTLCDNLCISKHDEIEFVLSTMSNIESELR